MADSFDPYHKWLGISPKDQPPHYYRLLALELFESDPDVIESAADQRMAHLRTFQTGQNSALSQQLLNELSTAKLCLLNPQKKADYDRQLRERLERQTAAASAAAGAPVRPLPVGQVPSDATAQRQAPRPVPGGASAAPAAPVVASGGRAAAPSILQRKSRQTPVWKQPAVLGTAGALVLFATAAYFLASSDLITRDTATKQRNEPRTTENTEDSPPPPAVAANSETNAPGTADRTADSPANASARTQSAATRPAGDQPDFEIIEAAWGAGEKWIDVTEGVRGLVRDHRLMMIVWSDLFGKPADPAPGVGKKLRIRYRSRGKEYTAEYFDSWFAYLDGNARLPPTDLPGALELVEARYGAGGTFLDVLPQLQPLVADGRLSVAADEFAATTAAELAKHGIGPNVFKVLWVRYRDHTGDHFDYAWNSQLLNIDTRLPPTAGRPIDLLRQIGLPGDVVYGDWSMKEGTLLAPAQMAARVQIPHRVPTDYALNVVVESDGQIAEVITGLVVGGRQVVVPIDSGGNSSFSGMALLHGLWHGDDKNPTKTWRLARLLEQGRPNTLTYIVHPTSVRVLRDGAQIVHWSGDPAAFSIPDNWKVFDPQKLYLQSYNSAYRITKVELTPLEPEKSPVLSLGDSGLPVDVLKSIDLERDRLHGDWQYDGQALVSPADDVRARLRLPAIVPDSYQLDFVAQRESGSALILTVPIAGTEGTLMIDGYQGKISGLQKIDNQLIDKNETRHDGSIFDDGKRHLVRLTVLKNHVRLLCDGKSIVDWTGDVSRLKSTEELPYHDRIYVGTWQARYRFTQMKLRALRDDTASEPTSALAGEPVDLLKRIDVARDQVDGDWKREGTALLSPRKAGARLQIPYEPGGEYTLTVTAERLSGTDSFILGLIVGGRQVAMTLDGYGGETSGLADLDQHDGATNETTRRGRLLPPGKPHTIVCTVRDGTVNVSCDDKQVLSWSGDPLRLTNSVFWTVPNHRQLFLGAWESEFKFTRVEMQPRRSASSSIAEKPLQQPAAGNPPQAAEMRPRTLGDLVAENSSRAEVPDDEALKKARHEMRKKFASSLKAAKLPEQKRRLAEDLAEKAAAAEGAAGYVLWIQAIDLAKASGDIELAWLTIDRFARAFDVDRASLRNDSLAAIGKAFRSPEHAWALTDAACRLMVWALAAGDAEAVRKAATQAQNFARRLDDRSAQKVVTDRANDAGKLADEWDAVAAARQTLKDSPGDPEANFTVGHYELCAAGDWDAALPKLARCGAAAWKEAAADELALAGQVADPQRQMATGDGWWSLAEDEPWPGRHFLQVRAARRYRLANRGQPNDIPIRALERLKALLAVDEGLPNWEVFRWQGFQAAAPSGEVARLENMFSLETVAEFSEPIEVLLVVKTSGTEVRLGSHGWSWNWKFVVEPDQWHTLRYVINPLSRTVFVDGVLMQTDASRTPRSLNSAPVALHRNNDAVIEIRKFIVRPL